MSTRARLRPTHILLVLILLAVALLTFYPPQWGVVVVRKPLPGPAWLWRAFAIIEQSKWK